MTRRERWGPWVAAIAVSFSFVVIVGTAIYSRHHQAVINQKLCQQTVDNRESTREVWDAARGLILRGQPTIEQRTATNQFFDSILETIPPLECIDNKPVVKEE